MDKIKILIWLLLGIIFTYAVGTWIYIVEIRDIANDKGAAYASMFGWMATIFAGGVAAFLFIDWKEQHIKTTLADIAKNVWIKIDDDSIKLFNLLRWIKDNPKGNISHPNSEIHTILSEIRDLKSIQELNLLYSLTKDKNLEVRIEEYRICKNKIQNYLDEEIKKNNKSANGIRENTSSLVITASFAITGVKEELTKFIKIK